MARRCELKGTVDQEVIISPTDYSTWRRSELFFRIYEAKEIYKRKKVQFKTSYYLYIETISGNIDLQTNLTPTFDDNCASND